MGSAGDGLPRAVGGLHGIYRDVRGLDHKSSYGQAGLVGTFGEKSDCAYDYLRTCHSVCLSAVVI